VGNDKIKGGSGGQNEVQDQQKRQTIEEDDAEASCGERSKPYSQGKERMAAAVRLHA